MNVVLIHSITHIYEYFLFILSGGRAVQQDHARDNQGHVSESEVSQRSVISMHKTHLVRSCFHFVVKTFDGATIYLYVLLHATGIWFWSSNKNSIFKSLFIIVVIS